MVPWKLLRTVGLRGGVGSYLHLPLLFLPFTVYLQVYLHLPLRGMLYFSYVYHHLRTFTCIYLPAFTYIYVYIYPLKLPSSVGKSIFSIDHRLSTWELVMGGLLGGSSQDL